MLTLVTFFFLAEHRANDGIKIHSYYAYIFKLAIFLPCDDSRLVILRPCVIDFFGLVKGWFAVRYIEATLVYRSLII